jgi:N utilization substance protein B
MFTFKELLLRKKQLKRIVNRKYINPLNNQRVSFVYIIFRRFIMSRKISRELGMKMVYQMDMTKEYNSEKVEEFIEENSHENFDKQYLVDLGNKIIENKEDIDSVISNHSKKWKINRIAKVDLSILRVAVAEIKYIDNVPFKVAINEGIELAKRYSDDESTKFINGLLGSVINDIQK